jgi:ferredoxin
MKKNRKIIEIDENLCDGCGKCIISCAEGAIRIENGKAKLLAEWLCDGLGACMGDCPTGALKIIEREADEFDEEAAHEFMKIKKQEKETAGFQCPSARFQNIFDNAGSPCGVANIPSQITTTKSFLTNWPVKINLIPSNAPFLKNTNLLIAADCVSAANPDFHNELLKDKVLLLGCPKFDDQEAYIQKFAEIFSKNEIKSLIIAVMEVPCCSAMEYLVKKAMDRAGKKVFYDKITVGIKGEII